MALGMVVLIKYIFFIEIITIGARLIALNNVAFI